MIENKKIWKFTVKIPLYLFPFKGFKTITNCKNEIVMLPCRDFVEEDTIQKQKEILISILSSASPLNGKGYFQVDNSIITSVIGAATTYIVVLVQFNISEKSSCLQILEENTQNNSSIFDAS